MYSIALLLAVALDPSVDLAAFAQMVLAAATSGNWPLLVVLALIGAVELFRKFAPWPWAKTKFAGWATLFVFSALGALGTALVAGSAFTWALAATALGIGFTAAGGYQAIKDFLPLVLEWVAKKRAPLPAPPPVLVDVSSGSFKRPSPEAVAQFEADMRAKGYVKQADGSWKL